MAWIKFLTPSNFPTHLPHGLGKEVSHLADETVETPEERDVLCPFLKSYALVEPGGLEVLDHPWLHNSLRSAWATSGPLSKQQAVATTAAATGNIS